MCNCIELSSLCSCCATLWHDAHAFSLYYLPDTGRMGPVRVCWTVYTQLTTHARSDVNAGTTDSGDGSVVSIGLLWWWCYYYYVNEY